jgi:malonyl CoA-acyl carrier protein transacylase
MADNREYTTKDPTPLHTTSIQDKIELVHALGEEMANIAKIAVEAKSKENYGERDLIEKLAKSPEMLKAYLDHKAQMHKMDVENVPVVIGSIFSGLKDIVVAATPIAVAIAEVEKTSEEARKAKHEVELSRLALDRASAAADASIKFGEKKAS